MRRQAAELVHQASFLHGSLMGRAGLSWQHAGHWLLRATEAMLRRRPLAHDQEADEMGEEEGAADDNAGPASGGLAVWRAGPSGDCQECLRAREPAGVRGKTGAAQRRTHGGTHRASRPGPSRWPAGPRTPGP